MNESEFLNISDALFDRIEAALDAAELDLDIDRNGNVMEIEFDDGAKLIINRHLPNAEIWVAARSGGFHYRLRNGAWCNTRDEGDLFAQLGELIKAHAGQAPGF
ncbi:iron donor protein CyaY [Chitinimonas sp.]|uniref:iron donor protein CyaY n=1 Tax=Chitinimonas sp. TaxID=1934313 RepID=UPI0035B03A03